MLSDKDYLTKQRPAAKLFDRYTLYFRSLKSLMFQARERGYCFFCYPKKTTTTTRWIDGSVWFFYVLLIVQNAHMYISTIFRVVQAICLCAENLNR